MFRGLLVKLGMWGMLGTLALLSIPGTGFIERELTGAEIKSFAGETLAKEAGEKPPEKVVRQYRPVWLGVTATGGVLVLLGISAGLFSVPVQVYLQARRPPNRKAASLAS